jgi:hypothetical protein
MTEQDTMPENGQQPSDETLNTGTPQSTPEPAKQPVPYDRFAQVNREKNEALKKLKEYEQTEAQRQKEAADAEREKAIEAGEFEKVLADLRPKADLADKYEAFIKARFEKALEAVPEELRDLIPSRMNVVEAWSWLENAQAKGQFKKPDVPNLNAGERGEHGTPKPDASKVLKKLNY